MKFCAVCVWSVWIATMPSRCADDDEHADYILQRNFPLQDLRVVRDNTQDAPMTNFVTENPFIGSGDVANEDFSWLDDAIKDIAYYLRAHKFNEYDRRYELKPDIAKKTYYGTFPRPPLRTLHWEVQKFCEVSFLSCAEYLKTKVKDTGLRRVDDTSVVMQEQGWNVANNTKEINEVDSDCVKIRDKDDAVADPFQGPIERFQWRTTASYYMCWYTMNEVADLRQLNENCDNYANCLDRKTGPKNNDIRANDAEPFMCATYSFCPDPCCPESKHLSNSATCRDGGQNPCYEISPPDRRECSFVRSQNRNFHDIVLNRWNVSCHCPERGFVWSSRYGICIDVDECLVASHDCDNRTEICVNLPGSFECGCRWGYMWSIDANHCVENKALGAIKLERKKEKEQEKTRQAQSLVKRLYTLMVGSRSNVTGSASGRDLCRCTFISHLFLLLFSKLI